METCSIRSMHGICNAMCKGINSKANIFLNSNAKIFPNKRGVPEKGNPQRDSPIKNFHPKSLCVSLPHTRLNLQPKKIHELKILDPKKYVGPPVTFILEYPPWGLLTRQNGVENRDKAYLIRIIQYQMIPILSQY